MKEAVPWWFFFPDVTFHYLMWLSVSPPCHGDDVAFHCMMWLGPGATYYALFAEVVPAYLTFSLHGGNVPLVTPLTYLFWMGGTFVFFIWWFGMKKGCSGAGSSAPHVVVNDGPGSCAWQLMNQGSFGGSLVLGVVLCVFSALVFICVLCLFLFFIFFSFFLTTVTSSLFIVSFVHSVLLLLKSNNCGRMIVCNAKQCWQKSSLQCEGWALSCLL